jgi:hypothetical protein
MSIERRGWGLRNGGRADTGGVRTWHGGRGHLGGGDVGDAAVRVRLAHAPPCQPRQHPPEVRREQPPAPLLPAAGGGGGGCIGSGCGGQGEAAAEVRGGVAAAEWVEGDHICYLWRGEESVGEKREEGGEIDMKGGVTSHLWGLRRPRPLPLHARGGRREGG